MRLSLLPESPRLQRCVHLSALRQASLQAFVANTTTPKTPQQHINAAFRLATCAYGSEKQLTVRWKGNGSDAERKGEPKQAGADCVAPTHANEVWRPVSLPELLNAQRALLRQRIELVDRQSRQLSGSAASFACL